MGGMRKPVYECINPKCRSKNLRPIAREPRSNSGRGNQQRVYECADCGWTAGEMMLERTRVRRELGD